jgi:stage V sporulation protein AD
MMKKSRKIIETDGAVIISSASAVGGKEFEGPLGACFDFHDPKDLFGQNTFEKSEAEMQRLVLASAIGKAGVRAEYVDALFAGDLLNQCVSSAYGLLEYDIPYFGLYGACSTAVEGLILASLLVSNSSARLAAAVTSSHNAAAERQYRNPLEYGGQRAPTAQWTVTGAGAFVVARGAEVERSEVLAEVICGFPGIVVEKGVTDAGNMGAAMAPAAADTLLNYFEVSSTSPTDYDMLVSGDLGQEGTAILGELLGASGVDASGKLYDCGMMIYDPVAQDVHCGGSGCGCSASVVCSYIINKLRKRELNRVLFVGTGALLSPTSSLQGESVPGIAHGVLLTSD